VLVYFITCHSIRTFQCCHVQYRNHNPLSEMKKRFSDQALFITVNEVNKCNM
jgi:hypothetical protein